ncbi:helix-turn-helix domain-containing protein [Streptomyces sp. NPDC093249]|uniref:helix-turn-helix domain-containing protein n=1 Tax=unclassified Streptomyces TaxID=2593676 RepID=UPI00380F4FA0
MSIPSPADLARLSPRPRPLPPPVPPADLDLSTEPYRALWERGITGSQLHRNAKLVGLVLAAGADWATGQLADPRPSVGRLATRSGLHDGQVITSLNYLEARGWITRPDRRARWSRTEVSLTIPGPILPHLR